MPGFDMIAREVEQIVLVCLPPRRTPRWMARVEQSGMAPLLCRSGMMEPKLRCRGTEPPERMGIKWMVLLAMMIWKKASEL